MPGSSLIVESGKCSAEWLISILPPPWFREVILRWNEKTSDLWPIHVNRYNQQTSGVS